MTSPVLVERVLTDEHHITVTLNPEDVIDGIIDALRGYEGSLRLAQILSRTGSHAGLHEGTRRALVRALSGVALQVTLTPDAAEDLTEELAWAARPANACRTPTCGQLADHDYCATCHDAGAGEVRRHA